MNFVHLVAAIVLLQGSLLCITAVSDRITCRPYPVTNAIIENGVCDRYDMRVGTKCKYECFRGYRLIGSSERICQRNEKWSGNDTRCEAVTCPPLSAVQHASVHDKRCLTQRMRFDSYCRFECPRGYVSSNGYHTFSRYCLVDGTWDGKDDTCKDVFPPKFTNCRWDYLVFNTTYRLPTGKAKWAIPSYTDNSLMGNNKKLGAVTLYREEELNIGTHIFRYIVEDEAGLKSTCDVRIMIEDIEAPYFIRCPTDMTIEATNQYERVGWDRPIFKDNSGKDPHVSSSQHAGTRFRVPGKAQVTFVATDEAGNKNTSCKFEINLKMKSCPRYEPPKNGALACLPGPGGQELQCQVYCRDGFEFASRPSLLYFCSGGSWNSLPLFGSGTLPWPDCAEKASSSSSRKMSASYYYVGDCNKPDVQDDRKKVFVSIASDLFTVPPVFCKLNPTCKPNNVNVFCGESSR